MFVVVNEWYEDTRSEEAGRGNGGRGGYVAEKEDGGFRGTGVSSVECD